MSRSGSGTTRSSTVTLAPEERGALDTLASRLVVCGPEEIDNVAWVGNARDLSCEVPPRLRMELRRYLRDSGRDGFLLFRGLPVDECRLPATPAEAESAQRTATHPASLLALIALQLGEVVAYREEKWGALIQDVVPVPGLESMQGNAGSDELSFHVENAFHVNRPDFICLLCLRPDHDRVAGLRLAAYRRAVPLLSLRTKRVLTEPRFATVAPDSFADLVGATASHAILEGSMEDPDIRVDFTSTSSSDDEARHSMVELRKALLQVERRLVLGPGDLIIVDNRAAVHGRTAFHPRYDGKDRWLQRVYVQVDLRRSRDLRPGDGHIVHSGSPV